MAEAARADDDAFVPAPRTGIAFLTAWIAVRPASASAAISCRLQRRVELDDRARAREQVLGEAAVAVDARERAVDAVHVVAAPAGPAQPAGDERVDDDRVADLDVRHAGADLVDPARVLVAGGVGQLDLGLLGPLALLDVEVGAAQPRRADLHDDVERPRDLRLVDLVEFQCLVVGVQARRFHDATSSWSVLPYRTRSRSRHMPPLASRLRLDELRPAQPHRQVRRGQPRPVAGDQRGRVVVVRQAERGAQRRDPHRVRRVRQVRDAPRDDRLGRRAIVEQPLTDPRLAGQQRLALEQLAQRVEVAPRSRRGTPRRTPRRGRSRR